MKYILYVLVIFTVMLPGCGDDDDPVIVIIEPSVGSDVIHFDGVNNAAPSLPQGIYEAAARFTASDVDSYEGRELTDVEFFLYDIPSSVQLLIYDSDGSNVPGDLLYNRDITADVKSDQWNSISLNTPVEIIDNGFWISIYLDHPEEMQSIGCDAGPRNINGDWLYDGNFNDWMTFFAITQSTTSINWNIRGITSE